MDPVITVAELQAELDGQRPPVVLDLRWKLTGVAGPSGREAYERGHLPRARFVDLDRDLAGEPGGRGRHPLPTVAELEALLTRVGVTAETDVVCYDQSDGMSAARCWWTLRYLGHAAVRVLDGGYDAWVAAGGVVVTGGADGGQPVDAEPFVAQPAVGRVLDAAGAARVARTGQLLDARSAARYRGDEEPIDPIAGHIPGAISAPTLGNVADGRWLSPHALQQRFEALGLDTAGPIGVYCGSGVTAAHEVLALERAGISAALYVGSWSEWISDPTRPVATGAAPG